MLVGLTKFTGYECGITKDSSVDDSLLTEVKRKSVKKGCRCIFITSFVLDYGPYGTERLASEERGQSD